MIVNIDVIFRNLFSINIFRDKPICFEKYQSMRFHVTGEILRYLGITFCWLAIKSTFLSATVTSADSRASGFQESSVTTCASNSFFTFILLPATWLQRSKQIDQNRKFLGVSFSWCKVEHIILGRLGFFLQ